MNDFEKQIHAMFDHIWDCDINHPIFDDTVGELMNAVIQCYNNLPSAEPHWIPVSERLPEELKDVLVCTKRGYVTCGCCVNDYNYRCVDNDFFLNLDGVVAWMPLPKPLKEGEQDG